MSRTIGGCLLLATLVGVWCVDQITLKKNDTILNISFNTASSLFDLTLSHGNNSVVLNATLGHSLNLTESNITKCVGLDNCYRFGDDIRMHVSSNIDNGFTIYWKTKNTSLELMDCFDLDTDANTHWYGGPERNYQYYPIEKLVIADVDYTVQEQNFSAISEPYWVNSKGAYLFVDERVPLFVDQNSTYKGKACFIARQQDPYQYRQKIILNYTLVAQENVREAHIHAVQHFLGKPKGHPNTKMISRPIWSTWARYKKNINDSVLIEFANEIVNNGFGDGQFEIDDYWETCYGSLTFGDKFPNINGTVQTLKDMDFRVTLWVHPFVNVNCTYYIETGTDNDFFTKSENGTMITKWWNSVNGNDAFYIDFTNPEARQWFTDRLNSIKTLHGIDAFKFDAGEPSFATDLPVLAGDIELTPNSLAADYAKTCSAFGDLIEIRTGYRTQYLPVFVRMIDKDSYWGDNNGLYTLITTLITLNLNGYVLVLPDMVGGNGYEASGTPDAELFIRWLQANTFMPAIQFSFVPWDYGEVTDSTGTTYDVVEVSKTFVSLHDKYSSYIIQTMNTSIEKGYPVNAPLWWVDPTDATSLEIDTEYMLGEDILVAPVILQGAVSRDVYLPEGTWIDGNDGSEYSGRQTIKNYSAPLDTLPYFIRKDGTISTSASFTINSSNFLSFGVGFVITILIFVSS